ncbi:MAG: YfhO family protein [Streptococcaceae bacterium]|nr:YfhO family protein [Streptococcaceae bacterium]
MQFISSKKNLLFVAASFFLPVFILAYVYLNKGIFPGSERSILASDAFAQFSSFHASFNNVLHGKESLFYTWNAGAGLNYLSLYAYYLGGIFTPIVGFFSNENMPDALYFLTLLKIGASGCTMYFLSRHILKEKHPLFSVAAVVPYALMSFAICQSELIMWIDAYFFLPLVILGIRKLLHNESEMLLFFAYLGLFLSNFYFGFMIGIFSFLVFCVHLFGELSNWKRKILHYTRTTLLSILASTPITLPVLLDLRANGETLSAIQRVFTESTGPFDLLAKNFLNAYDTTKYGSVPFVYIGLIPLLFALFFFVTARSSLREKILSGSVLTLLIASFYFEVLNLFWQGMHSPNMFLFRFAFLFSFFILYLGLQAFAKFKMDEFKKLNLTFFVLSVLLMLTYGVQRDAYSFLTTENTAITFLVLMLYFLFLHLIYTYRMGTRMIAILLLLLFSVEATINTNGMIEGVLQDWNYASRSLYTDPQKDIKTLVDAAHEKKGENAFFRMANLEPITPNDSLNFGYSDLNFFSSIRNRHSSQFLDKIGFKSEGTALNLRYDNNTLIGDALMGMSYNINPTDVRKFGFSKSSTSGKYNLYENKFALPLGFMTTESINSLKLTPADNLYNQRKFMNVAANVNQEYFHFEQIQPTKISNATVKTNPGGSVTYTEKLQDVAKVLDYTVSIPKGYQAYLSLFLTNPSEAGSSTAEIKVNDSFTKSQMDITGQYYTIGFGEDTVSFSVSFYGSTSVTVVQPKILLLNLDAFQTAVHKIQERAAVVKVGKRSAEMVVESKAQYDTLYTSIPYDSGWTATVDGTPVTIQKANDAFVSLKLSKGKHTVKFSYLPPGFLLGMGISLISICSFLFINRIFFLKRLTNR